MYRNTGYPIPVLDRVAHELDKNKRDDLDLINFCQACSHFDPFDHVDVAFSRTELGKHIAYTSVNGQVSLRQAISRYYGEKFNYELDPERICITVGATEALTIAFAMLTEPGSEVILAASHWPPYRCSAHMYGVHCRFAPINNNNCLDVTQISDLITTRTAAIVVNSPSNPHGAVLSTAELAAIADLGVPVIFDEVYQALGLKGQPVPSAISHSGHHFIVSSFSKSLSLAGFRIGYLIVPENAIDLMTNIKSTTVFSTSSLSQAIVARLLPHWDSLLASHKALLQQCLHHFAACVDAEGLTLMELPEAGLHALVDISEYGRRSADVTLALARNWAIGVAPGSDFQMPDPGYLRFNYAIPVEKIRPGLKRIAKCLSAKQP